MSGPASPPCPTSTGSGVMASDICSGPVAPRWIQLFPFGTHETPKGTFVINAESLRLVLERAASHVNDYVADYEHATLTGAEAPAAGWITRIEARGADGLWGRVQWTPRARALIEAREYRYFSPVFRFREHDRVVVEFLHGGITNWPAFDGMTPCPLEPYNAFSLCGCARCRSFGVLFKYA